MTYTLLIGHRNGYKALALFLEMRARIQSVIIENEFEHEADRYFDKIIAMCESNGIAYSTDLSKAGVTKQITADQPDVIFVYGYRRMIPKEAYQQATHCALAIHYSLLPKYRGFAPVNWAMINGEKETGVSLFYLDEEMDSGDIVMQATVEIRENEDINQVLEKCDDGAMRLLRENIPLFEKGIFNRQPQNHGEATYTCSRNPEDGRIDWRDCAKRINDLIRAVTHPFPCAFAHYEGRKIRLIDAEIYKAETYVGVVPGRVIKVIKDVGVVVLTGDGAVLIKRIVDDMAGSDTLTADRICTSIRKKFE